jgi:hypothetical protein
MPLAPGSSRGVISSNFAEMRRAGYPERVAVAAALSNARRHARARGAQPSSGRAAFPRFDDGGSVDPFPAADPMTGFTPGQAVQYLDDVGHALSDACHGYQDWLAAQPSPADRVRENSPGKGLLPAIRGTSMP